MLHASDKDYVLKQLQKSDSNSKFSILTPHLPNDKHPSEWKINPYIKRICKKLKYFRMKCIILNISILRKNPVLISFYININT